MGTNWTDNLFPLWISSAGVLPEMRGGRHDSSRLLSIPDCVQDQQEPHYCILETGDWGDITRSGQNTEEEKCLVFLGLICRININDLCQGDFNILTRRHHISTRYLLSTVQQDTKFFRILPHPTVCLHTTVSINLLFIQFYQFQIYIFLFSDCK